MAEASRKRNCAIYTRKSSEEGLEQDFNSLDAQREACEAYIQSQKHEGWRLDCTRYDDGGCSGGTLERPALQRLMADIAEGLIDVVVVYKVDRLTRSLADFSKIVDIFDANGASFVSITQQFNTSTSMGRLTLNVLLSFAQFEREVTGERIRDKLAASAKKGLWLGGRPPLGYDAKEKKLVVNPEEAQLVRHIFRRYLELGCVSKLKDELDRHGRRTKLRISKKGIHSGGQPFTRCGLYKILPNRIYLGEVVHKGTPYPGEHSPILDRAVSEQVHDALGRRRVRRHNGDHAAEPCPLAGLLFDDRGNSLSPAHAVKNRKRYRYYVRQALIQSRPRDAGAIRRLPAGEIESVVSQRFLTLLRDRRQLLDRLVLDPEDHSGQLAILAGAEQLLERWKCFTPGDRHRLFRELVQGVIVRKDQVEIELSRSRLSDALGVAERHTSDGDQASIQLIAKARLTRLGMETRLVLSDGPTEDSSPHLNPALIEAVVQAHAWRRRFLENPTLTVRAVADEASRSDTYIARIMRLAYLAPDFTEAILQGRQPQHLSLKKLLQGIPLSWPEQRKRFGFEST